MGAGLGWNPGCAAYVFLSFISVYMYYYFFVTVNNLQRNQTVPCLYGGIFSLGLTI